MITFLSRILIKEPEGENGRKAYGTLCSVVGILLNVLLFVGKYVAGVLSNSVAIMADAFNNLSDAGSSFVTLVGFLFAGKKADTDHPFGHGRFEYISGFVVSLVILLMGFELMKSSVLKIVHPEPVDTGILAMVILIVSVLVKLYMAFYNQSVGKKIASAAMKATAKDSLSDSLATIFVLVAMLVMRFFGVNIDGICGVLVSLFIFYAGITAAKETLDPLLGLPPDKEFVDQIESIVMAHDMIEGIHDVVVHDYGPGRRMISLHAEVPGNRDIYEIHDLIDNIERELNETLQCEAVIHMDPIETDNEEITRMKQIVATEIKKINESITIHDFRMVTGDTHTNLIFDALVPFETKLSAKDVKQSIETTVENMEGNYYAVVHIDQSYL
ncbi:MAG: cation transporter [Lachnospiraceae bacterium]|nr:cation transporter [Lachnospiraceae bacterium]